MISIIIPAFNEAVQIGKLIRFLNSQTSKQDVEVVVVDGGSSDGTLQVVEREGAIGFKSPQKGRAKQMNLGAKQAHGEWLYFLHADTFPPHNFTDKIKQEIRAGAEAGCFRLRFDDEHPALRFFAWFTRFDLNIFRFGDQSLFVKKALFQKVGGFDEDLLVMEDQEIVKDLKKHAQFSIVPEAVTTSARKYQRFGVFRLQLIFSIIVVLHYSRISQKVIAHFYKTFMSGSG